MTMRSAGAMGQQPSMQSPEADEMATNGAVGETGRGSVVPPPIDSERRSRSPGLQHNFYDMDISDFKKPYSGRKPNKE